MKQATAIRKTFATQIKAGEVTGTDGDRMVTFVASTEDKDRDGEVILASAWQLDNYKKNPVVLWAHDYRGFPVGKGPGIHVADGKLILPCQFADADTYEFADTACKLAKGGYLNTVSVGFIPLEWEDIDGVKTFTKVELLEVSIVPIPSNPEALVSAREAGVISVKEFEHVTKPTGQKAISQASIADEVDYLLKMLSTAGINPENKKQLEVLMAEIMRLTGGDTPATDKRKALTNGHRAAIKEMVTECHRALDALEVHHKAHDVHHKGHRDMLGSVIKRLDEMSPEADEDADGDKGCECDGCDVKGCTCAGADCKDNACKCACHETAKAIAAAVERGVALALAEK